MPLTSDIDDETLFTLVEHGDVEVFTQIYKKYHKLLYTIAWRYTMSQERAEDAVQHVFTRFWEYRAEVHIGISLKSYLVAMTKNHILNVIRNENNALEKNYEMAQEAPEYEDTLVENLEKKELMTLFYEALDKLTPVKREICLLKVHDELTNKEIAERLQLSVNTIKTHYSEALKQLRVHLRRMLIIVIHLTLLEHLSVFLTIWTI